MNIIVKNKIIIEEPTQDILRYCESNLKVDNPEYFKKQKMGRWTGSTPKEFVLFQRVGNDIVIPFGCLNDVWRLAKDAKYKICFNDLRKFDYKSTINLYDYQEQAVMEALKKKNGILVMPCGAGKGLPLEAKIYTPTGWKCNGDLQIGDIIIGSDGKPTKVTNIFDRGQVDAYKITFSDDVEIVCDKDHLWKVQKQSQRAESGNWFVENTENIYKHYQKMECRSQLLYIPIVEPICFEEKQVPLNAWLLGFLLGDGCFQKNTLSFSNSERDIVDKIKFIVDGRIKKKKGNNYDYLIYDNGNTNNILKSLGLNNHHSYEKFIPEIYKYNSISVRLAVLQGLFDADGYINRGHTFEYLTTSKQIADDFIEIVESLGGTAKLKEKVSTYTYKGEKKTGRISYRIFFKLYKFRPFTSKKHSERYKERIHYMQAYRIIKKIEPCEPIISRCITVDAKNSLYVTNHFIVTHNTQTGLEIIARIGGRALWLTHTQDLLNQSKERAKSVFDCNSDYGTITSGKVNIGNGLTFATVQTMAKLNLKEYENAFDVVIVDECHKAVGGPTKVMQFYKVLSSLNARYKIGLTATPKRADGMEKSMFTLIGNVIHEVSKEEVKNTTCDVEVAFVETGYKPDYSAVLLGDGTLNYSALVQDMVDNEERFDKVRLYVMDLMPPFIVLANRVEYLSRLTEAYNYVGKGVCLSTLGQSKKAKAERKEVLRKLNNCEIDAVFATYQLAKEGLDVPNLKTVVFATPEKDETTVVQSVGRVGRKGKDKDKGYVVDFVDDFAMYRGWQKLRMRYYKKNDIKIEE